MGANQKILIAVCLTIAVCAAVVEFVVVPFILGIGAI